MRTGRKRKTNVVRDDSGKSRGEIHDPSFIWKQPHRRDCAAPDTDQAGYPLGRLLLNGLINFDQHRAGNAFSQIVASYARTMGIPMGSPRGSSLTDAISTGFYAWEGDRQEIDPEDARKRVQAVKGRYDDCFMALGDVGKVHGRGNKVLIIMREICVQEVEERELWADSQKLGDLRLGLNAVHKILLDRK